MPDDPWAEFNPVTAAYAGVEGQQPLGPEYFTPLVRSPMAGHVFMSRIGEGNVGGPLFAQRDERFDPYADYRANVPTGDAGFAGPDVGGPGFEMPAGYGLLGSAGQLTSEDFKPFDRNALLGATPSFEPKALLNWLKASERK